MKAIGDDIMITIGTVDSYTIMIAVVTVMRAILL